MLEFGASFRKARESQNVSIDKIAGETRINSRFLLAIENEQFEQLPGGIFNRGFIRSYAVRLGLDPEEAVLTYEKMSHAVDAEPAHQEPERVRGKTTKIPVYYVAIAGLVIFVIVFYVAMRPSEPTRVTASAPAPVFPTPEAVAPPPADATPPPAAEAAVAAAIVVPTSTPAVTPKVAPAVTPPPSPIPVPAATQVATATIIVELETREETWFKLTSDGNAVVAGEVLQPGTTRRYTASSSIYISLGNAGGVALRLNGQPVSSLGKSGRVRSFTITPQTTASSLADTSR